MKAIETNGLSKRYGHVKALSQVSFSVEPGEVIGLLGPNGAGKTTLMKILTGYLQPTEGEATIAGIDVVANPLEAQKRIGYLPENAPLYGDMAVQEYLTMMAKLRGVKDSERQSLLSEAIYASGLEGYLTRPISKLSKGYRQRVGIAQAILHQPELLILDEPTTGLDPNQIIEIRKLIHKLAKRSTVILSTHILSEVEMTCDRVLIIIGGWLRSDANLSELRASNSAIVSIATSASDVESALGAINGVDSVTSEGADEGNEVYQRWRVTAGSQDAELCPAIFDVVRANDWSITELRSAPHTLESVFRTLAEAPPTDAATTREAHS